MKISKREILPDGWVRFNLNVGGFCIKGCRWNPATRRIFFPIRYDDRRIRRRVIFAYGVLVKRLRTHLESGKTETPRDRRRYVLKIRGFGRSHYEEGWLVFSFTVRGFTILGCRWHPQNGSIQLPVTFRFDEVQIRHVKKRVVCAYGSHKVRLRKALEAKLRRQEDPAYEAELADVAV